MNPPPPPIPKLPSHRVSAALATAALGVGVALGALIGPGPAASVVSNRSEIGQRASALARVLALVALGSGASAGGELALAHNAPPAVTPQPTPPAASEASTAAGQAGGGSAHSGANTGGNVSSSSGTPSSTPSTSPSSSTAPAGGGEGEGEKKGKPLPPVADVWVIELPYGTSVENALEQSAAAPYLTGQLKPEGTVLSGYSSLAAGQLAGAAALLSGQVGAGVTTLVPPPCGVSAPCPSGEPAGLQAADAFLREAVPKILASTPYKEHGLILVTFGAVSQQAAQSGATTVAGTSATTATGTSTAAPAGGATGAEIAYPPGSLATTLSASSAPAGALVLSPFLRHPGGRLTGAFNQTAPHESLEALLRAKPASSNQ